MRPVIPDPRDTGGQGGPRRQGQPPRFYSRRDRAPSRLAFRLERMWLTPAVRAVVRIGAPIFVVTLGLGIWLGDSGRRADLVERYDNIKISIQNRPEFRISKLDVTGASPEVSDAVRMMLPVGLPASRFAIDLNAYHDAILRLDAVKDVALVVGSGGVLEARVTEREPVILWRTPSGIDMLDETGHRTASLTRRDARPDLALIAGDGADQAVPEALDILNAAKVLLPKMRGLVRIGDRRWDVVLDGGRRIELPAKDPVAAMNRVLEVDRSDDLLSRDYTRIDMRDMERPTIRLSANALEQFEEMTGQKPRTAKTPAPQAAAKPVPVSAPAQAKPASPDTKPTASSPKATASVQTSATRPAAAPRPAQKTDVSASAGPARPQARPIPATSKVDQ